MSTLSGLLLRYYRDVDHAAEVSASDGTIQINHAISDKASDIFATNVVYERDGWDPFVGKTEIGQFYNRFRKLCGQHRITGIEESAVIHPDIATKFREHFPFGETDGCVTLVVNGVFSGAQCHEQKKGAARFVGGASGIEIPFTDYWVFFAEKAIYRNSQFEQVHGIKPNTRNRNWERV